MRNKYATGKLLPKPKPTIITTKYLASIALLITTMCLYAHAQRPEPSGPVPLGISLDSIKPLQIGDTIPEYLWNLPLQVVNHPEEKATITLKEYQNKLIILDFWATWCTSCIAAMPKLHQLRQQFGDRLEILPVTNDAAEKASMFLLENKHVKELKMFSVIDDGTLKRFFPLGTIPHYVWVGAGPSVYAVTDTDQLTQENIANAIAGDRVALVEKLDIDLTNPQPLFLTDDLLDTELQEYTIFIKGQHLGLSTFNVARRKTGIAYGWMYTNFPLLSIYESVARRLFRSIGERYSTKRLLIESKKPEKLSYDLQDEDEEQHWNESNLYSCDVIVPLHSASQLDSVILRTLNNCSEFNGAVLYKMMKCRVLRKKDGFQRQSNYVQTKENARGFRKLILALDHPRTTHLPVIDESDFNGAIGFDPDKLEGQSLHEINRKLDGVGLELVEAERRIAMFVIRDN